ncbi:MAG TPA: choice-of-anchor D domain-containing protein [Streptosporangiaceae bacterium]
MSVPRPSARRLYLGLAGLALTLAMLPVLTGAAPGTKVAHARADDVTASQDNLRTGWDQSETAMGPSVVPGFSTLFDAKVAGSVYAQPLVVPVASGSSSSTVVVATENDYVYGLDPTTGAINWTTHLGDAFVIGKSPDPKLAKCGDLTPNIGITGTPTFNASNNHVYMFANIVSGKNSPSYYLVEVDPANGTVVNKTLISGHPSNDSALTFSAAYEMERPGSLLLNGWVYGAFASHCDHQPYTGYIAGVNLSTHATTLWTDESKTSGDMAGIWQSGGGVMSDGSSIFVTSGNGVSPAKGPGSKPPGTLAESVIRLQPNSGGALSAKDFFSPADAPKLDASDSDFGSGGPLGFPVTMGNYSGVLAQAGKIGVIYLLNRANLGGREQGSHSSDNALFYTKNYGGDYGHPAFFGQTATLTQSNAGTKPVDNDFMFYVGKNDVMRVFRLGVASNNKPVISDVGASSLTYGFSSGSPVVTSNGTDATSAVVWVVQAADNTGTNAELDAYALGSLVSNGTTPSSCTSKKVCILKPIWHSQSFTASKFSIPATNNGIVYVGDRNGNVWAWGKSGAGPAALQAATATLPSTTVNTTTTQTVSITAKRPTTVTGVSASTGASNAKVPVSQFTVGQATLTPAGSTTSHPVTFPVKLAKGDKLSVPVTFKPAAPGTADGTISFQLKNGKTRIVPVTGTGARTGLYSVPAAVAFPLSTDWGLGAVPIGVQVPEEIAIINGGSTTDTVRSVTKPSAPFAAANLPVPGQTLEPGQSLVVALTYTPTQAGPANGSLVITDSAGKRLVVPLSGVGTSDHPQVKATQSTVDFGSVPVGTTVTKNIHVLNTGTVPTTVSVPVPPMPPFHSRYHVFAGTPFNPGYDLAIPVMFSPTAKGTFTFKYLFHWTDRLGNHSLTVVLTGKGV